MTTAIVPLTPFETKARIHAHIAFFAYFFGLPIGVCIARYMRAFKRGWLLPHMIVNGVLVFPLVITAFVLGYQTTTTSGRPHFKDPHQRAGLALFILYFLQVSLGAFIHWIKIPTTWNRMLGHRPQNFLHIAIGLAILGLASWQTHYGLYTEWAVATGNLHPVNIACKRFWLGICLAVWVIYLGGMIALPRQLRQERAARALPGKDTESSSGKTSSVEKASM